MVYSMTGFGKAETNINGKIIQVEIRALNSKGFDANLRMPNYIRNKELSCRTILSEQLKRGKLDVFFNIQLPEHLAAHSINQGMAKAYSAQILTLAKELNLSTENALELVLKMPNVMEVPEEELAEEEWKAIENALQTACKQVSEFRSLEGAKTEEVFTNALTIIQQNLNELTQYEAERANTVKERIKKNIDAVTDAPIDENRLEQEIIYYVEKYDISEEKMRLKAHIDHFLSLLDESGTIAKGKKLGFVAQELGREINTIGSKANHAEIQRHVVIMKDHLEQIKEQLANIL